MKKQNKIARLRKAVDGTTHAVDALIEALTITRNDAEILSDQAIEELNLARIDFESTKAGYKELQSRCSAAIKFVNNVIGE